MQTKVKGIWLPLPRKIKLLNEEWFLHNTKLTCEPKFAPQNHIMEPNGYLPVIMQSLVALGFVALVLIVVPKLGPRRSSKKKDENFECGIESQGNARMPVSIKYLMTAILFVLFDVEVIFFYPYAVNFRAMGTAGFFAVLMFVAVFLIGFYYVLRKGAFEWDK